VLNESAKKLRDPLALGLLGVTALYLLASLSVLFNGDLGEFSTRAVLTQGNFVNPVMVIITVAAAMLVGSADDPTPMARIVVPGALGLQGLMVLFGVITWFAGYGVDTGGPAASMGQLATALVGFGGMAGAGKVVGTILMLGFLGFLGIGAFLTYTIYQGLPAPVRPQQQQQQWGGQQWGGQPQQQQWGGQQWGGQPQPQDQQWGGQQWGAAAGGAAAGGAAAGGWGQPTSGESSTGYAAGGEAGQPMPTSGESSTGYAAGGDPGQQQWGQPQADPTQQWGQPQPETQQQGEPPAEGEEDRPGWWSPSS
jgi:hypothetical protein